MFRLLTLGLALLFCNQCFANKIVVKDLPELTLANKNARPGDTIVLQNGAWKNVIIRLNCSGTAEHPVVFMAQTRGKVVISGLSQLRLGGNFIVIDGLLFANGNSPSSAVIDFRISKEEVANHCRVTNTVINDFNKPKRMSEDYWVSFSGKNNRLDHCSFFNKKNLGVLLAVILDDDRSRENFHSIDHNYFGVRPPLGSNGGEIIRVGVSEHCQFNSNTQIRDNFFEYCDGEAEVISIKSGSNVVSNNVFKKCQGSVVLRHGNDNTVTNNLFLGYNKASTGGVRIINRGQWVINNFFYQCRGESFRAPLVIMNGIPNSPANRYVQVTDAVVMNNTFVDCAPISLGEGSDKERTLPAANVLFAKNIFYSSNDALLYKAWDDISGIRFAENKISSGYNQQTPDGFQKTSFGRTKSDHILIPTAGRSSNKIGIDSLLQLDKERIPAITTTPGFAGIHMIRNLEENAYNNCGARWFVLPTSKAGVSVKNCSNAADVYRALAGEEESISINLTGASYQFDTPLLIHKNVELTSSRNATINFASAAPMSALIIIQDKGRLGIRNLRLSAASVSATALLATDTAGSAEHFNFSMKNVVLSQLLNCQALFWASKSTFADSIIVENCKFSQLKNGFVMNDEKDNKGYYNAEKIRIINNEFSDGTGELLNIYRGGNDESTLGPNLTFSNNRVSRYNHTAADAVIELTGVQQTKLTGNTFSNSAQGRTLIRYQDTVRARHVLGKNNFSNSGAVIKDQFVIELK